MNGSATGTCSSEHCITCGDDGVEMVVVGLGEIAYGLAECRDATGAQGPVEVTLVAPVGVGSVVLVHAGVAIAKLAAAERADALEVSA